MSSRWLRLALLVMACSFQVAFATTKSGNVYTGNSNAQVTHPPCPLARSAQEHSPEKIKKQIQVALAGLTLAPEKSGEHTKSVK